VAGAVGELLLLFKPPPPPLPVQVCWLGSQVEVGVGFSPVQVCWLGSHVEVGVGFCPEQSCWLGSHVDVGVGFCPEQFGSFWSGTAGCCPLQFWFPNESCWQVCWGVGFGQPLPATDTLWPWTFLEQTGLAFGTLPSMFQAVPSPEGFVGNVCGVEEKSASAKLFQIFAGQ